MDSAEVKNAKTDSYAYIYESQEDDTRASTSTSQDKGSSESENTSSAEEDADSDEEDTTSSDETTDSDTTKEPANPEDAVEDPDNGPATIDNLSGLISCIFGNVYDDDTADYVAESIRNEYDHTKEPYSWFQEGTPIDKDYIRITDDRVIIINPNDSSQTYRYKYEAAYSDKLGNTYLTKLTKLNVY